MQTRFNCTQNRAKKMVCFVWSLSIILATPILYGQSLRAVGEDGDLFWCVKMWPSKAVERLFEIWMLVLVLSIPLSVMIFAYVGICRELWNVMAMRGTMVARRYACVIFFNTISLCVIFYVIFDYVLFHTISSY
ncbi:hypothetical protein HELRODRAFT_159371 [Helobdella robusta]|uniref:G-protein coupled receptors family 1 profile domain-containing protein n=1 Tax=Helobdella robusta TaxID=6412 RepID=T1ENY6_HELRO|nr:hypothetical protein HELRODRAFT_159371 [Helobdella robusta]ESO12786.1 hypothetical protein HELRODRAFT_159371 [Helobdella robusta]